MNTIPTFFIADSQFNSTDSDMPDMQLVLEALTDVYTSLGTEDTWIHKGNYQMSFWLDDRDSNTIYCNVYVLANPDDMNDSSTLDSSYYFEIQLI